MSTETFMGKITFINHEKGYATIEYTANGKKKTISGNISEDEQSQLKAEKIIKKIHQFHVGDEVNFIVARSKSGDKMIADCIEFKFNNALDNLINKSAAENRFAGYLKKVDEEYFVKETGSYIFFPLKFSPWERKPADTSLNEPFFFRLENTGKTGNVTAASFKPVYIPEYLAAMQYFKNKTILDATVYKTTPHGIFVNVVGEKIRAKLPLTKTPGEPVPEAAPKAGDVIKIRISYLGSARIIVERV